MLRSSGRSFESSKRAENDPLPVREELGIREGTEVVREVRKQENDYLSWNQKMLTRLATEAAQKPPDMEQGVAELGEEQAGAEHDL